jgi:cytochrome o ubiquinol oxidase subunit 2
MPLRPSPLDATPAASGRWRSRASLLLPALAACLLTGCAGSILDPAGRIAAREKHLILVATGLMLLVVIPVIAMTLAFAWRYRASNARATYAPQWASSKRIELVTWSIPCIIIAILATLTWRTSHELDPYRPIAAGVKPITIDVVALDWKWLFIYPEQRIATVNEIAFPVGVPVSFRITSHSVMNSFFIPRLGSQVYAMPGMQTQLNLIADQPGSYDGMSANYSGPGFSDMKFTARATSAAGFEDWVEQVRNSSESLAAKTYSALAERSRKNAVQYFAAVDPMLYDSIVEQYVAANEAPAMCGPGDAAAAVVAQRTE